MYFNLNSKLFPGKSSRKVNKQKIRCKNLGFVLVVSMSWTRYILCIYGIDFELVKNQLAPIKYCPTTVTSTALGTCSYFLHWTVHYYN